jgi:23S rRNA (adenine2503-C2)-methyltransferase
MLPPLDATTMAHLTNLLGLDAAELRALVEDLGQPAYRAEQVMRWLYARGASSFEEMTNLPLDFRGKLAARASAGSLRLERKTRAPDRTTKFAFRMHDGPVIESVFIPHKERATVCVSSQAGCGFGCAFCASGAEGLERNLSTAEIVEQVLAVQREAKRRITNVVFMGMGEPLSNYDNVMKAVRMLNDPKLMGIAARHIAISTCGLPRQIHRLAGENIQVHLAVSLHAPNDSVRDMLMPINIRHPIAPLMAACRDYVARTKRKITFEYALIAGRNDTPAHARELAQLVRGMQCVVNLIPLNEFAAHLGRSSPEAVARFAKILESSGVEVALRRERGAEVRAACGQLAGQLARRSSSEGGSAAKPSPERRGASDATNGKSRSSRGVPGQRGRGSRESQARSKAGGHARRPAGR